MRSKNMRTAVALGVVALVAAAPATGEIVFQEDFESGSNPFDFEAFQPDGSTVEGNVAVVGSPYGQAWRTELPADRVRGLTGHRVLIEDGWRESRRLHWAAYVKFGDQPDTTPWRGDDDKSFQFVLPLVTDATGEPLLSGRFLAADRRGRFGTFELTTADGRVHRPIRGKLLAANRWNAIEFGVEDRGAEDRVRIWIDNDDPVNPDYEFIGGDMADAMQWRQGLRVDHGHVVHPPAEPVAVFYDTVTVADDFIGLPVTREIGPMAPGGLRVE